MDEYFGWWANKEGYYNGNENLFEIFACWGIEGDGNVEGNGYGFGFGFSRGHGNGYGNGDVFFIMNHLHHTETGKGRVC
jgi:hypothetical protein